MLEESLLLPWILEGGEHTATLARKALTIRRYLASGGHDSIVNLFDTTDWISARTINATEFVPNGFVEVSS